MKYFQRWNRIIEEQYSGRKKDLAEALGITPQQLSNYLKQEYSPNAQILEKLVQIGIDVNWFLTGEGEMLRKTDDSLKSENEALKEALFRVSDAIAHYQPSGKRLSHGKPDKQ